MRVDCVINHQFNCHILKNGILSYTKQTKSYFPKKEVAVMYSFAKFEFKKGFVDHVQKSHPEWLTEFAGIVKRYAIYSNVVGDTVESAIKEEDFDERIEQLTNDLNAFFEVEDVWEYITMYVTLLTTIRIMPHRVFLDELKEPEEYIHAFAESLRKVDGICYLKHSPVHIDLQVIASNVMELMQAIEDFTLEYLKTDDPYVLMEFEVTEPDAQKRIQEYIENYREKSVAEMFAALEKLVIDKERKEIGDDVFSAALEFANRKHAGQKRKDHTSYILHPIRVAMHLQREGYDIRYQIAGLFHDLLEDTDATELDLKVFCDDEMLEAIHLLTRDVTQAEGDYVKNILTHPMAKAIKNADRIDNLKDLSNSKDEAFVNRYLYETKEYFYGKFSKELDEVYVKLV